MTLVKPTTRTTTRTMMPMLVATTATLTTTLTTTLMSLTTLPCPSPTSPALVHPERLQESAGPTPAPLPQWFRSRNAPVAHPVLGNLTVVCCAHTHAHTHTNTCTSALLSDTCPPLDNSRTCVSPAPVRNPPGPPGSSLPPTLQAPVFRARMGQQLQLHPAHRRQLGPKPLRVAGGWGHCGTHWLSAGSKCPSRYVCLHGKQARLQL